MKKNKDKILLSNKHQSGTGTGVMDLVHSNKMNKKLPAKPVKKEKYKK